jgi:electron transfer flavoprotein-quinone oxidoreductase
MTIETDIVVVGAGPAGSAAALVAARAGAKVVLLERGPFPGSKNLYGGVAYLSFLDTLLPQWRTDAPLERWITARSTMVLGEHRSLSVTYEDDTWRTRRGNGATLMRSQLDPWLASQAVAAGATLLTSTTATKPLVEGTGPQRRVVGVATDQGGDNQIRATWTIASDGANSRLAREAGLYPHYSSQSMTLGIKETLLLPAETINERFHLRDSTGVDIEILGCTGPLEGGGFLYTNRSSISLGIIVTLSSLSHAHDRLEELLDRLKAHPSIAPFIEGSTSTEYGAHLIPEGGWLARPHLSMRGLLVCGDAASLCLSSGIWLEGVNYALGSGAVAGDFAAKAVKSPSGAPLSHQLYAQELESSFVGVNHRRLKRAPKFVLSDVVQHRIPKLALGIADDIFTVTDPVPKPSLFRILRRNLRRSEVTSLDLLRLLKALWRGYR